MIDPHWVLGVYAQYHGGLKHLICKQIFGRVLTPIRSEKFLVWQFSVFYSGTVLFRLFLQFFLDRFFPGVDG